VIWFSYLSVSHSVEFPLHVALAIGQGRKRLNKLPLITFDVFYWCHVFLTFFIFFSFCSELGHVVGFSDRPTGLFTVVWKPSHWKCIAGAKSGAKYGKKSSDFHPKQTRSYSFGPESLCKILSKSNQNCGCRSVCRQTDRMTSDFIICPMLYYSSGTDNQWI